MKLKIYLPLLYLLLSSFTGCFEEDDHIDPIYLTKDHPDLLYSSCIWDRAIHSAFTDLVEYNNSYYCCFREGHGHLLGSKSEYGKIRILRSEDGITWVSVALIADSDYDLRDPKLSVTPDNRLMLLMGAMVFEEDIEFSSTMVSFSTGENKNTKDTTQLSFSSPSEINIPLDRYWLWRITWKDDLAYGVAYDCNIGDKGSPFLVTSKDGINYDIIVKLDAVKDSNEADVQFVDNKMVIVIRNNCSNGYFGFSSYPYTYWDWTYLNYPIHSPKIINIEDQLFVAGRGYTGGNMIYQIDKKKIRLNPIYVFSGGGDTAYPGAILVNNELWMSYYSTINNRTTIYFVKVSVAQLLKRIGISK